MARSYILCTFVIVDGLHTFSMFSSTGGESRVQLDAAAATAAELGLELAPVELNYTTAFDFGNLSFRVVNPTAAESTLRTKAEVNKHAKLGPFGCVLCLV